MKHDDLKSFRYRVVLIYGDGSMQSMDVVVDDDDVVVMVARGWLMAAASAIAVRYRRITIDGHYLGLGGEFVK